MKKTLLICPRYPLPEDHGQTLRTMNFVRFFKNYGTIDIAYSSIFDREQVGNPIFSHEYLLEKENAERYQERLIRWAKIKSRPIPVSKYSDASEKQLLSLIESNDYDYILTRYVINTWSLFKLTTKYKMRTIIDFDDILSSSLYESMFSSVNRIYKKLIVALNRKFLMNYEKKCLNFSASLFCSEEDKAQLIRNKKIDNAFVVPNIYENKTFEDYNFGDGFRNGNILLFVGALGYAPNIIGLKWFIESVFPEFKKAFSDAKLLVVGHSPDFEIKRVCESEEGVELYADVPDLKEYYKHCKAVVVPLLTGGGTRIKILEAALANRPVLSTPVGSEGLDFTDKTNLLLFENAHEFSAQYKKLLDKNKYDSLIQSAKKLVLTKYSMKNFNNAMEKVLNEIEHIESALSNGGIQKKYQILHE
jgi:glycosyltransferase involved in cell wall biosynthesis